MRGTSHKMLKNPDWRKNEFRCTLLHKSLFIYTFYFIYVLVIANQHTDIQIRQCYECYWVMSMTDYGTMFAGNADASCPDADSDATYLIWIQFMLILILIYVSELCPWAVMNIFYRPVDMYDTKLSSIFQTLNSACTRWNFTA